MREAYDVDFVETESDVDALLMEARLVKDIQPKFNRDLRDDKSFPYLQITTHEDFPRVEVTREPQTSGVKLYGPFANAGSLRGAVQALQKVFKFRTCSLDIEADDERWRWFRPCLLASINQCTAPCNLRIGKEEYRKDIKRLRMFLEGNRKKLLDEMRQEMAEASAGLKFEQAARLRDEIEMLERLGERGELETHEQPEVFYIDPKKGLAGLAEDPQAARRGRGISKASTSPTWAATRRWPAWCSSSTGCRSSRATGGFAFATWRASTITRASAKLSPGGSASCATDGDVFPDVLLIDGGIGQLRKALEAFAKLDIKPPLVLSLAKKEELVYVMDREQTAAAEPAVVRAAAVAIRARRGAPLRAALPPSAAAEADLG